MLRALLWDVDGTLAETERDGHLVAFNDAFAQRGVPWRWSEARYGELLEVAGGRERLLHDMATQPEAPESPAARAALAAELHALKNARYTALCRTGRLPLRPGVAALFADCARAGMPMGIVTTTSVVNVDALLTTHLGGDWRRQFAAVIGAEQAPLKKPHPSAYQRALEQLGLAPGDALAIEDAPAGVLATRAAGVPVVIVRSIYFKDGPTDGAVAVGSSLDSVAGWSPPPDASTGRIDLAQLRRWHGARSRRA